MSSLSKANCQSSSNRSLRFSDRVFTFSLIVILCFYALILIGMLLADVLYLFSNQGTAMVEVFEALQSSEIKSSIYLSLLSCSLSAFLSIFVAVPIAYFLATSEFRGKHLVDAIMDIPIILPPLVIGMSLLILFQFAPFTWKWNDFFPSNSSWADRSLNAWVVYQVPAVIIAQFTVAAAFAIRTLKVSFEQLDRRPEQVAWTLGCSRYQAFKRVSLPQVQSGIIAAWTLAWARSLGEFGPILMFAGATRNKTEVLSTTVFIEMSTGNLKTAVAVSLIMILTAFTVLITARVFGNRGLPI